MADLVYSIKFDDGEFLKKSSDMVAAVQQLEKEVDKAGGEISKTMKENASATDKSAKSTDKLTKTQKQLTKEQKESLDVINRSIKDYKVFGLSINDVSGSLRLLKNSVIASAKSVTTLSGSWKLLTKALIASGIGAVVVAFGSLVTFLTKTQKGAEILNRAIAAIGQTFTTVTDAVSSFGEGLFGFFTGGGKEALVKGIKEAREEIGNLGEDLKAADDIARRRDALAKTMIGLRVETASARKEIFKYKQTAEDLSKPFEERLNAVQEAFKIEQDLVAKRLEAAREQLAIEEKENAQNKSKTKDFEAQTAAAENLAAIELESIQLSIELKSKENALLQEQEARIKALRDAYVSQYNTMKEQLLEIELAESDPLERLEKQREIALKGLEEQKGSLIDIAKSLGEPIEDIEKAFEKLAENVNLGFDRAIDGIDAPEIKSKVSETLKKTFEIDDRDVPELTVKFASTTDQDSLGRSLKNIAGDVDSFLNSPEFLAAFDLGNKLADSFQDILQGQIDQLDALSEQRGRQIEQLQEDLELEEQLMKEGSANNVATKREELAALQKEQEEANKKANELRKQQIEIELAQSLAQQSAALAQAVANIFLEGSKLPLFVGIAAAAGIVAGMLASVASANSQIKNLTALSGGAERLGDYTGYVAEGYGTDRVSASRGLRVVHSSGRDTGVRLGGNEMIVDEGTSRNIGHIIMAAKNNSKFADDLNAWYNGVDATPNIIYHSQKIEAYKQPESVSREEMEQVFESVMDRHLEKYFKKRGKEIASQRFISKESKRGILETVLKDGSVKRNRSAKG